MTNVCGKQSTYKKDVREGKGGDNNRLWWRECMMDGRGGRGGQMYAAGTVSKQDEQEGENGRGGQMNAAGTVWRQDEQEGEEGEEDK